MSKFSRVYKTFSEWSIDQITDTGYKHRIVRLHSLYPNATLSQLRGHALKAEKMLSKKQAQEISKRSWKSLSHNERLAREKSLEVVSDVRRNNKSLSQACKDKGISPKSVLKNTNAFKKNGNRWVTKSYDKVSRVMWIISDGKRVSVEIKDSRTASRIGKYHNAIKKYLNTGDASELEKFAGKTVKDAQGNTYVFETDTEAIEEALERIEDIEGYEVYQV